MDQVLFRFSDSLTSSDGVKYLVQAVGAPTTHGLWEAWIEFLPIDGSGALKSPRETTQPNRADAEYWASGLSAIYLAGALDRALGRGGHRGLPHPELDQRST
jgi:hypothetical protein